MIKFNMDMPLYLMSIYGSVMLLIVLLLRGILKKHIHKGVFPVMWALVLVRLLVPLAISSPISAPVPDITLFSNDVEVVYSAVNAVEEQNFITPGEATYIINDTQSYFNLLLNRKNILLYLFCLGAVCTAGILYYQKRQYSKSLKNSMLIEHNDEINKLLRDMSMGDVLVFTNDEIASPLVCGLLYPKIYLPTRMNFKNTELLKHILSHETIHIKRKDNWVKGAMLIALCLNWYNPLVWLMSKALCSDLEAACDAVVLKKASIELRQGYASSLLAMAVSASRSTLLYSAFSKSEVERRIKSVLNFKKATSFMLVLSLLLVFCTTAAFAAIGQAPFSDYLSSFCSSASNKWGVNATLSRDIALGENSQARANGIIIKALNADTTNDPDIIANTIKESLAQEFKVEKNAFKLYFSLCLSNEALLKEYIKNGITKSSASLYYYKGEPVRVFSDKIADIHTTSSDGTTDVKIERDKYGNIINVAIAKKGDAEYDKNTINNINVADIEFSNDVQIVEATAFA